MGEIYKCCENPQITYLAPVNFEILFSNFFTIPFQAECKTAANITAANILMSMFRL